MFSKAPWRCPKCHAKNVASAEQAGQAVACPACGGKVRLNESLFAPDVSNLVNAACLALLIDLGSLVSEEAQGEAFHRMLPVLKYVLADSEEKGRDAARSAIAGTASN